MGDNNIAASDEDKVHVSQLKILKTFSCLSSANLFSPAANFGMNYMHYHAYYPEWHFNLQKYLNLINMPTIIKITGYIISTNLNIYIT